MNCIDLKQKRLRIMFGNQKKETKRQEIFMSQTYIFVDNEVKS